jgi:hypothetical protein
MKRFLIGFLSALLVVTSVFGATSKGVRSRRAADEELAGSDQVLWI